MIYNYKRNETDVLTLLDQKDQIPHTEVVTEHSFVCF